MHRSDEKPRMSEVGSHPAPNGLPPELLDLWDLDSGTCREEVWGRFVERHSRLILKVSHSTTDSYDGAMDRYAFVLQHLREDECRRLKAYRFDHRGKFTTWLVVVARRLCADFHRSKYGRTPKSRGGDGNGQDRTGEREVRARLANFLVEDLDPALFGDVSRSGPEIQLRKEELFGALEAALSQLSPRDRLLVKLRYQDGLPAREIAELMAFPTTFHVYRQVKANLRVLRASLERDGFHDPRP